MARLGRLQGNTSVGGASCGMRRPDGNLRKYETYLTKIFNELPINGCKGTKKRETYTIIEIKCVPLWPTY